ncbi:ATP-binding protein [Corynebacterium liangguodongii]|uniref:AAA family ATPase n=1 Tax=Corynebacterium liangguodongii TaxID=2079535 RepID=A0A2S0WHA0_9CORY|nr:DUF4143 domain-containing protein [Corynebacterium liangguodongii]AWB85151.1 AAA family ATPase [Corynebacterium liangguodongii]PWB99776.1 ATP-binding protein [Corynebacterium liangguodongii]
MKSYIDRVVDHEVRRGLKTSGALVIKGPRACGKTSTAQQFAASAIQLDRDTAEAAAVRMEPSLGLEGARPRLIDEWQAVPAIWNEVRHAVDSSAEKGQYLLTGSATPDEVAQRHSGAGRIRSVIMRTLTLMERGVEAEPVSLSAIIDATQEPTAGTAATVADYADLIVAGGFPEFFAMDPLDAQESMDSYVREMSEHDYPQLGGPRRDPRRFHNFLRGYAGLVAQPTTAAAIRRRIGDLSGAVNAPAPDTVNALHDFAARLFLIEDQPAWSPSLRSKATLVHMPKRHLADPSLAAALLGVGPDGLLRDLDTFGMFFESQLVHDLNVYAQHLRARGVFHLRDMKGREEIDAVIGLRDGRWVGFEAKLSHQQVDAAAAHLLAAAGKIDIDKEPAALIVVIPSGPAFRRADGVWVVPLAALGP